MMQHPSRACVLAGGRLSGPRDRRPQDQGSGRDAPHSWRTPACCTGRSRSWRGMVGAVPADRACGLGTRKPGSLQPRPDYSLEGASERGAQKSSGSLSGPRAGRQSGAESRRRIAGSGSSAMRFGRRRRPSWKDHVAGKTCGDTQGRGRSRRPVACCPADLGFLLAAESIGRSTLDPDATSEFSLS